MPCQVPTRQAWHATEIQRVQLHVLVVIVYVMPSHGCMLYHMIVMLTFGVIINGIVVVVVVVCLSTLHWYCFTV